MTPQLLFEYIVQVGLALCLLGWLFMVFFGDG